MKRLFVGLFPLVVIVSCKNTVHLPQESVEIDHIKLTPSDSFRITIQGINLSEDMSRLSTKNDEIFVLVYEYFDSLQLNEPLVSKELLLAGKGAIKTFRASIKQELNIDRLLFLLIEQDSERPKEQLDPIIRVYYRELMEAYHSHDYDRIEKYLGDEDVLGIKVIERFGKKGAVEFKLTGIHKLDKYEYHVKISR